jgi:aminoglycoside phosphotransferase (APT) family kinase protein
MAEPSLEPLPEGIAERYGLAAPARGERLRGGASGTLFRAGDVAVRLEHADPESVRWEHELVCFLAEAIDEVVAPMRALDGSTFFVDAGRVVSVFPFVDGDELRSREESFRQELPRLLGRLHRRAQTWTVADQRVGLPALRERDWDRNDWWDWSLVEKTPPLVRAFEELREWVESAPDLCVCAIHGDFHPGNLLVRDGRIVAIIDWQYARRDWPAFELASTVWDLASDDELKLVDTAVRDQVVHEYLDAGGPGEPEVLVPMARLEALVTVLFSLTRAARGLSWNPDFTARLLATLDDLA